MNPIKLTAIVLAGTAAVAVSANPAKAFTITSGGTLSGADGYKSSVVGAKTVDFNSGAAPTSGAVTYSGLAKDSIVEGSKSSNYAAPSGDQTKYLTIANQGSGVAGATGSVTLNFAKAMDYFGLYWGSIDTYNFIDFYAGNTLLKTFGGADVSTTAKGSWTGASDNVYVNFLAGANETFDKVVLRSNGIAFESDNHAYREASAAVPEPFTIGGSLIGLAFGLRMRKKQKAQAS